ncbi:unnamed protein product, partial [Medioppia subpectinata]
TFVYSVTTYGVLDAIRRQRYGYIADVRRAELYCECADYLWCELWSAMNRQSNFGFGGRQSGIRPPQGYGGQQSGGGGGGGGQSRPKTQSTSSMSSIPSTASSRKTLQNNNFFNFPGSGGSSRLSSNAKSGAAGGRQSVFGNFRPNNPFSSARKSVTSKIGPLFGLTPQHNRASYQPQSCSSAQSSRRSSIGGSRGHVKDSRPLSEMSYHRQCVAKVVAFLTENQYPSPISKTFGSRPTVKEIANVFEFLFNCYGIRGKIVPMDVEIPKIMASLEYPFPVKKSDLVSFTSGRALGSVLGMLEWLVDSLSYTLLMDPIRSFFPNFEGEIDVRTELIRLCLRANDEGFEGDQLDACLHDLVVKTYGTEDDFEQMMDESEALEQEVQRLDEEIQQIRELPQTIQTYDADIKSYDNYMTEMTAHRNQNQTINWMKRSNRSVNCRKPYRHMTRTSTHRNQNQTILESLEKDCNEKMASIKKLEEQRKCLKSRVEEQEFGIEEAVLAKERKQQLEDEIKQEFGIIDDIRKGIRSTRLECSKYEDVIKKMHSDLDSFIAAMADLVDSPVMASYSSTLRHLIQSPEWMEILTALKNIKTGETTGASVSELEKLFSHKVHELKIAIVQQLSSLQGSVSLTEQQKLNEFNLVINEKEKQLKQNEKIVAQLMSDMENQRKDQVSQVAALQSECDRTRQLINEFDGNTKRSHKDVKQNLLDLQKQVEEKQRLYGNELSEMSDKFENSVNIDRKGINELTANLDAFIIEEKTKTKELKKALGKSGSDRDRKAKEKRDKKDKTDRKNKENK